jgi:hypothetical protein
LKFLFYFTKNQKNKGSLTKNMMQKLIFFICIIAAAAEINFFLPSNQYVEKVLLPAVRKQLSEFILDRGTRLCDRLTTKNFADWCHPVITRELREAGWMITVIRNDTLFNYVDCCLTPIEIGK